MRCMLEVGTFQGGGYYLSLVWMGMRYQTTNRFQGHGL